MTINAGTGEINWPNPPSGAVATPTVTVTDSERAAVSQSWSITVSTAGFIFVDAVYGRNASNNGCTSSCGSGTRENPWRDLNDLMLNDHPSDITYFRGGVYSVQDVPSSRRQSLGSVWERVVFSENPSSSVPGSVIWLGYPGETPILDFTCTACTNSLLIRHQGSSVYMDGLETRNSNIIAFQFEPMNAAQRGGTYRRLNMHTHGPGADGTNAAFIMTVSTYPAVSYGMVIQDSTFSGITSSGAVTLKIYSSSKLLVEDTTQFNVVTALELKADVRQFTVRGNRFYNVSGTAIGGNMHGCVNCNAGVDLQTTRGEVLYNNVQSTGIAYDVNQDGQALEVYATRNTFVGRVQLRNTDDSRRPVLLHAQRDREQRQRHAGRFAHQPLPRDEPQPAGADREPRGLSE